MYTGWSISIGDGVLVNGMGCFFSEWGVSIWDGVLIIGIEF